MTFASPGTSRCPCTGIPADECDPSDRSKDGDLCYKQMDWIDTWMNDPKHKKALGANPDMDFQSCNMEVNQAFFGQGDGMHNSAALLPPLIFYVAQPHLVGDVPVMEWLLVSSTGLSAVGFWLACRLDE